MEVLNNDEMLEVKGGGLGFWIAVGAAVTFIIGVIDGITNPTACRQKK